MNSSQKKILQLESTVHALEESLAVSESSFLKESKELEKVNEQLLKENTYRAFFEASPVAMLTLYDNRFVDCNESAVKMLRAKSRDEVLNTHPWELSPEYQPDGRLSSEKAAEMIAIASKQGAHFFEWEHKRMDGEIFPVDVTLTLITVKGEKMLNVSWRDISERKQAERELNEYHQHLEDLVKSKTEEISIELEKHKQLESDIEQILEASSDAIRVIDKDYNIIYTSKSFNTLYGHHEDIIGKKCYEVVPEKECHTEDCPLKRILKVDKKFVAEKIFKKKDGTERLYRIDIIPYNDSDGNFLGIIKNYRDITEERQAEERLAGEVREREMLAEKYRILFESSGDAIVISDEKGFFDCNKAALELIGYSSKEELVGKTPVDIGTAEQPDGQKALDAYKEHVERAVKEGSDCFEWICVRKDGTVFPTEVMLSCMEYQGRTVMLSVVRDITERKEAEKRLAEEIRERESLAEKYRILFESSGDAITMFDEEGFFDCNKKNLELLGYSSKEEFFGKTPMDISTAKQSHGQELLAAYNEHIRRARKEGTDCFEWFCEREDGTSFPVEVMLSRMEYQGKTVMLSIARDISERKEAEEKIRHISAVQNLILENSTLGIGLVRNRVFEWVNPRVGELLQLPVEKIQGASTRVIYPSDESYEELGRMTYPDLVGGGRSDNTLQLKRSDGSLFWCRFIGKALDPENIENGSIWMLEDITEEKEAQRIAKENAQQQGRIDMANNMLHDIGNAMTGISTYVLKPQMEKVWQEIKSLYQLRDLFTDSEDKIIKVFGKNKQRALNNFMKALISSFEERRTKQIEFSEKISSAVGHVCSVLELQRHYLKENASPLTTKINLPTIINDTLVMLSGSLRKRNIKLTFDVRDKNLNISGDQTRLIRVFLNVIKNTCEAFDEPGAVEDGRKLEINLGLHKDKKKIEVIFSDNGIGFAAKSGEEFFERGVTSKVNGSGIGLHECRSIIESHGGTITMKSEGVNTGALTTITFPIF